MQTIQDDPIIAAVRALRDEHAARFDYDVAAIFQDILPARASNMISKRN